MSHGNNRDHGPKNKEERNECRTNLSYLDRVCILDRKADFCSDLLDQKRRICGGEVGVGFIVVPTPGPF